MSVCLSVCISPLVRYCLNVFLPPFTKDLGKCFLDSLGKSYGNEVVSDFAIFARKWSKIAVPKKAHQGDLLWVLMLVTCDRWHKTRDTWHLTIKTWHLTPDIFFFFLNFFGDFFCMGATIHTSREIQCLPYAGFFLCCSFFCSFPFLISFNMISLSIIVYLRLFMLHYTPNTALYTPQIKLWKIYFTHSVHWAE